MNRNSGLTIIEILVALAILGIVLGGLAYMQLSSIRMTASSDRDSKAMQLAIRTVDAKVGEILFDAARFEVYSGCPATTAVSCTSSLAGAEGEVRVSGTDSSYLKAGLIMIEVDVTGPGKASLTHFVSCMDLHPVPTVADPYPCPEAM